MIELMKEFAYDYERCTTKKERYDCAQTFFRANGKLEKAKQKVVDDYLHYVRTSGDI